MKKLLRYCSIAFVLFAMAFSCGCKGDTSEGSLVDSVATESQTDEWTGEPQTDDTVHLVCNFESEEVLKKISWAGYNCYESINTDERFISSGKGSLKLVYGGYPNAPIYMESPCFNFWSTVDGFFTDNRDPRQYACLKMDVFNASAFKFEINLSLMDKNYNRVALNKTLEMGWNELTLDLSDESLIGAGMGDFIQISVYLPNPQANDPTRVFYVDNLHFVKR